MPAVTHPRYASIAGADTTFQAASAVAVTPSDANELQYYTSALWVGGSGAVSVVLRDDSTPVTFQVFGGTLLPFYVRQVRQSGTTATNIVALY